MNHLFRFNVVGIVSLVMSIYLLPDFVIQERVMNNEMLVAVDSRDSGNVQGQCVIKSAIVDKAEVDGSITLIDHQRSCGGETAGERKGLISKNIGKINCNILLQSLGYQAAAVGDTIVGGRALYLEHDRYYDHETRKVGDTRALANLLCGNKSIAALEAIGVQFSPNEIARAVIEEDREKKTAIALGKLHDAFPVEVECMGPSARAILLNNKINDIYLGHFGYIPSVESVDAVLLPEEKALVNVANMAGKLLYWIYAKDLLTGCYVFGDAGDVSVVGQSQLLNIEALLDQPTVFFIAGVYNYITVQTFGKVVCGALSYNLTTEQKKDMRILLRMRNILHSDWTFVVIRGDGDQEFLKWLYNEGISCRYNQTRTGEDINSLHKQGREKEIVSLLNSSPMHIDKLFEGAPAKVKAARANKMLMTSPMSYDRGKSSYNGCMDSTVANLIQKKIRCKASWRDLYDGNRIEEMYRNTNDGISVMFREGEFVGKRVHSFDPRVFIDVMGKYQTYDYQYDLREITLEYLQDVYVVGADRRPGNNTINLYTKTKYLTEKLEDGSDYPLPTNIGMLLENLASPESKEYLLNMLACYVQTFEKPQVIPLFMGAQGTGKGTFAEIMGAIIGDYTIRTTKNILEPFDGWKKNSGVILFDELRGNTASELRRIEREMLSLVNAQQSMRGMYKEAEMVDVNCLILIANNADVSVNIFRIEKDDRRYLVISGGADVNLVKTDWWNRDKVLSEIPAFARYLRTRTFDKKMAGIAPMSIDKQRLIHESIPELAHHIRNYLNAFTRDGRVVPPLLALTQIHEEVMRIYHVKPAVRPQDIKTMMEDFLDLDDYTFWCKPNNKAHFRYEKYHNERIMANAAKVESPAPVPYVDNFDLGI